MECRAFSCRRRNRDWIDRAETYGGRSKSVKAALCKTPIGVGVLQRRVAVRVAFAQENEPATLGSEPRA
jgi:hypothetical protein